MAEFIIVNRYPGGTREQYDAVVDVVHPPGGLPQGQLYHQAGPTADGAWTVVAVWESKEVCDRFISETLMPGLQKAEGGFSGPPEQIQFEGEVKRTA